MIAGHWLAGIWIAGADSTGHVVAGNLIGTNATGQASAGNATGVRISHGANGNLIGGPQSLAPNVISGNSSYGVVIDGALTTNNTVQRNFIGYRPDGYAGNART